MIFCIKFGPPTIIIFSFAFGKQTKKMHTFLSAFKTDNLYKTLIKKKNSKLHMLVMTMYLISEEWKCFIAILISDDRQTDRQMPDGQKLMSYS